jgi:hypothetical protein
LVSDASLLETDTFILLLAVFVITIKTFRLHFYLDPRVPECGTQSNFCFDYETDVITTLSKKKKARKKLEAVQIDLTQNSCRF